MEQMEKSLTNKWAVLGVTTMLQHRPSKVGEAIQYQGEWKVSSKSGLGSLCSGLIQTGMRCEELVRLVGRVVSKVEVNWKALLALVTISLELQPQFDAAWYKLTGDMIKEGLEESDQESFLTGLLMSRQAALCSSPSFQSYSSWFSTSFGDEQTSFAAPSKSHKLLISTLEKL